MRALKRNKQKIQYALLTGTKERIDEYGNGTGSFENQYGVPITLDINVSANKGEASQQPFGKDLLYDRTMSTCDMTLPINEFSVLWLDNADITNPHNYIIKAVATSLNSIQYAIQKVNVSA